MNVSEYRHELVSGGNEAGTSITSSRVPDALRRAVALRRAGTHPMRITRRDGPRLCSASSKGRCAASGARAEWGATLSPRHCEEPLRRSNPESFRGGILDCFVLAMTEYEVAASLGLHSKPRHAFTASRRFSPELCLIAPPSYPRGCREGRVPAAPAVRCAKAHAGRTAQQHTGEAQHTAFPARWSDGLCRALPGAEFLLASLALAEFTGPAPVGADAASARA
ncbi:hypothetical protein IQ17_04012 [Bradyrhizobium daqingense]|uniref:Uncharacterized protein n=1 Tax=Bradyrhizobium daqingense TaxID=993502 RepID=A0A562L9L3_9BRAD|nr:hypothetical protein IQ17_04012 [Bradyrhizobium daqingense]